MTISNKKIEQEKLQGIKLIKCLQQKYYVTITQVLHMYITAFHFETQSSALSGTYNCCRLG